MIRSSVIDESGVSSPLDPCDWSCCETSIENHSLIDKTNTIPSSNHPEYVSWSRSQTRGFRMNSHVCKHFNEPVMGCRMDFGVAEYLELL